MEGDNPPPPCLLESHGGWQVYSGHLLAGHGGQGVPGLAGAEVGLEVRVALLVEVRVGRS